MTTSTKVVEMLKSAEVDKGLGTITIVKTFQKIVYAHGSLYPTISPVITRTEIWGVVDGRLDLISMTEDRSVFTTSHIVDTSL